ncbi:hypothetical protein FE697_013130 [Mumia zhuanghuii]|uniref:Uncharacterized protein n=1 Tax=Mumia zhuanghuii TaxID=2585211 RepID=A0A5Q6RWS1_9ACTN|nr:hypothetical protein FE697_013130 [Mumia zhuanghuii]
MRSPGRRRAGPPGRCSPPAPRTPPCRRRSRRRLVRSTRPRPRWPTKGAHRPCGLRRPRRSGCSRPRRRHP